MISSSASKAKNGSGESPTSAEWSGRSRGGGFGYRFFIGLIRHLGVGAAYAFLAFVAVYFIPFAPRATRSAWHYHRRVRGRKRLGAAVDLVRHYYVFGQTLIDRIALSAGMKSRYNFDFDNYEEFLQLLGENSGVVMIGAHVGNWQAGAGFFGDYARKMNVVMLDAEARQIKQALERNGGAAPYKVIALGGDGLDSVLKIKNALDAGEPVCFQGDRFIKGEATVSARFMGFEALLPKGPFAVAARMRVPVVFYYAMRERGRRYRFNFELAKGTTADELLAEYLQATERVVKKHPLQWFNFYEFWK